MDSKMETQMEVNKESNQNAGLLFNPTDDVNFIENVEEKDTLVD